MNSRKLIKSVLRNLGMDLIRYDKASHPLARRMSLIKAAGVDVLFDVGANQGQYAREMRQLGFAGKIVSFEPTSEAFEKLKKNASADRLWTTERFGLGKEAATTRINIAGNSYSSSILPMLSSHAQSAPTSQYVGSEEISVRKLDDVFHNYVAQQERPFLKIDTQGYEKPVLEGAEKVLSRFLGLQLELSLIPLYGSQATMAELVFFLEKQGFTLMSLEPGFSDPKTGQLLQVDGIFFRKAD